MKRMRNLGQMLAIVLAGWAVGCSTKATTTADASAATDTGAGDGGDTATVDSASDTGGGPRVLKWAQYAPTVDTASGQKLRSCAIIPGQPGQYAVVGDKASAWQLSDTTLSDLSPKDNDLGDLQGVWVSPTGTWYVVGSGNSVAKREKNTWIVAGDVAPSPPVQFKGVAGSSDTDVWAVGSSRNVWHFDGTNWLASDLSAVTLPVGVSWTTDVGFNCVATRTPGDVYVGVALSSGGAVLHGKNGAWSLQTVAVAPAQLWVADTGQVYAVGGIDAPWVAIGDGSTWTAFDAAKLTGSQFGYNAVGGVSASMAWIGGTKGQLRVWDGKSWNVEDIKSPPGTSPALKFAAAETLIGLGVHAADERVVLTASTLYRWAKQPL